METVRQLIMTSLDARLKSILAVNGYETNIGQNVFDWKSDPLEDADLPALIYRDVSCDTEVMAFDHFINKLTVNVMAVVNDATPMATVRKILGDLSKAIGVDDTWEGNALYTQKINDETGIELAERKYMGCNISIVITYRTRGWNEYEKL